MSDFPGSTIPTPPTLHTWMINSAASAASAPQPPASRTWVTNLAIYAPVLLPWPYTVNRVWWVNGSSASSNADFGIYTADGTRLYSTGSTAQSGASVPQFVVPTAFQLSPGAYYFAWSCNGTTNRSFAAPISIATLRASGVLQQSVFPLPATMTGAAVANALYPFCGISRLTTSF